MESNIHTFRVFRGAKPDFIPSKANAGSSRSSSPARSARFASQIHQPPDHPKKPPALNRGPRLIASYSAPAEQSALVVTCETRLKVVWVRRAGTIKFMHGLKAWVRRRIRKLAQWMETEIVTPQGPGSEEAWQEALRLSEANWH